MKISVQFVPKGPINTISIGSDNGLTRPGDNWTNDI